MYFQVAMYAMPTREQLLNRVCLDVDQAVVILPDVLSVSYILLIYIYIQYVILEPNDTIFFDYFTQVTQTVYDRTEQMYTDHDLHGLP